jgi:hypothetical protein
MFVATVTFLLFPGTGYFTIAALPIEGHVENARG